MSTVFMKNGSYVHSSFSKRRFFVFRKSKGSCDVGNRLDGKTAIITGSNTGIGKFTALDFFRRGCRVVMACRNIEKGERARGDILTELRDRNNSGEIMVKRLDLSSLRSVRKFAEEVLREESFIHILVNNAGVMMCPKQKTEDGFEMQFGTNHLGHFLLTVLLLPRIIESAPSRIINVSSMAYIAIYLLNSVSAPMELILKPEFALRAGLNFCPTIGQCIPSLCSKRLKGGIIDFDDLNWDKKRYSPFAAYASSKLANVLFTKELARRLYGLKVNTYAVHPGLVRTELGRHMDSVTFPGFRWLYRKCFGWCAKTAREGAETTIHCAIDEEAGRETGLFYKDCKTFEISQKALDENSAKKLWEFSWNMVGLGGEEVDDIRVTICTLAHKMYPIEDDVENICLDLSLYKMP